MPTSTMPSPLTSVKDSDLTERFSISQLFRNRIQPILVFVSRRVAFSLAVLLAIIFLTYLGMMVLQGTDFRMALPEAARSTWAYLVRLFHGDLGMTQKGNIATLAPPVMEVLPGLALRSLGLLGATFLLSFAIGLPLGAWTATRRHSRKALLLLLVSIVGISTPSFFAALFFQISAIKYTRTFGRALIPVGGFGWDKHLVLPMLVLAARPVAQITRITFVSLSEIFDKDYVRTARSKGVPARRVFLVHIVRNAAVPILTTLAVSLRFSLSSLPVVEAYFDWGGMGQVLLRSIFNFDYDLTIALFLTLGLLFLMVNLCLEIAYLFIDPRLREQSEVRWKEDRGRVWESIRSFFESLRYSLVNNPVSGWFRRRHAAPKAAQEAGHRSIPGGVVEDQAVLEPPGKAGRWRAWKRGVLGNIPLLIGGTIVSLLVYLTIFGPRLAPYSPNTTQQIAKIGGVLTTPPFPPSPQHPWGTDHLGRDMLSLVLSGVQQTMILAFAVVAVRMLIGFILGVLAGWFHDSWFDRLAMTATQAIAAYPTLLLAALLVFVFGIQKGISTFIFALSLVGWGEIMELVRSEVLTIRPKPFIESAVAIGQHTIRMITMHVLPNIAPVLVSVAAIEVGGVLLVLGELGFLGIFIQGGAGSEFGLYAHVPEWGALLSGIRTWTRAYPWTGFYPTVAFFIAILGFNFLGEGIRKLVSEVGFVINRLVNRYSVVMAALLVASFFWARGNTGELAFYRQQAATFDGEQATQYLEALADPEFEGRAVDSPALPTVGEYIRDQFIALGLQAAGEDLTYFQSGVRSFETIEGSPILTIEGQNSTLQFGKDFTVYPKLWLNSGGASGPVRFLAVGAEADLSTLDFSNAILLLYSEDELPLLAEKSCRGVLIIARDLSVIKRRYTYSSAPPEPGCGRETPVFSVSDRVANRLLSTTGQTVGSLDKMFTEMNPDEVIGLPTGQNVNLQVTGTLHENVPVVNVIGYLPGTSEEKDDQMFIVATQYDNPPKGSGAVYPGANDNASGVAVMLAVIQTLQESGYEPFKTFLFVAYSGEGLPDAQAAPAAESFLKAKRGFKAAYTVEGVIFLRGFGAGQEDALTIWTRDKSDLAKMLEVAARLESVQTDRVNGDPSMNIYAPGFEAITANSSLPQIGVSLQGFERSARLPSDTTTFLNSAGLKTAGKTISLVLMLLGR